MWIFDVIAGNFVGHGTAKSGVYAGNGPGFNNPAMENVANVGPLPRARYTMKRIYDDPETGKNTIELIPDPESIAKFPNRNMYSFRIHGINPARPLGSSKGCICVSPGSFRVYVFNSGDHELFVV